jgi:hypothetical protein
MRFWDAIEAARGVRQAHHVARVAGARGTAPRGVSQSDNRGGSMLHPYRRRALHDGAAELRDSTRVMIDPVALFERSFEVADAYEEWLEAQAELFSALYWYSMASLGLFRTLSGKQGVPPAGRAHPHHARRLAPRRQGQRAPEWPVHGVERGPAVTD